MGLAAISKSGLRNGLSMADLTKAFMAHNDAVKAAIPANRLLVYEVKQGWDPLCKFLGMPVPTEAFPQTNGREEFWEMIKKGAAK